MRKSSLVLAVVLAMVAPWVAGVAAAPPAAAVTATTPMDATYIRALYRDVLQRTASDAEVNGWVADLTSGTKTRTVVVEQFVWSPESLEKIVRARVPEILRRPPTTTEVTTYSALLRSTDAESELQIRLLGLSEAFTGVGAEAWITTAYRLLAGRAPTTDELATRTGQLAGGQTHNAVARNIAAQPGARLWRFTLLYRTLLGRASTSSERAVYSGSAVFKDLWYRRLILAGDEYYRSVNRVFYECFVRALYRDLLGRTAGADEVSGWVEDLVRGRSTQTDVAKGFVRSDEYANRIITGVYQQVHGRTPSAAELSFYRARLTDRFRDDHWSRTALLVQAVSSAEFLAKYQGRDWVRRVYQLALGRAAGEEEVDGWMGPLASLGYAEVATRIARSDEALRLVIGRQFEHLLGIPAGQDPSFYEPWRALMAAPPEDLGQNAEFVEYAEEVGGKALVGKLVTTALTALGVPGILLFLIAVPDAVTKAERLYALAHHPLHDLSLTIRIAGGAAYFARAVTDTSPPTTTASRSGTRGLDGWYRSNVTVTLRAADAPGVCCTGLLRTEYRIGSGPWQGYSAPIVVKRDGRTTITYRSVDVSGNVEAAKTIRVKLDKTRPAISIGSPAPTVYPPTASLTLTFHATDATSGIRRVWASLDGTAVTNGQVIDLSTWGSGEHTLTVKAVDRAGNLRRSAVTFVVAAPPPS